MKALFTLLMLCTTLWASAQLIPNAGFESANDTTPTDWNVDQIGASVMTNYAHTGSNSIAVWNWYYYAKGWAVNGQLPPFTDYQSYGRAGTPIDQKYDYLTGYYRYDTTNAGIDNTDSAYVAVLFKRYDAVNQKTDTVAFGEGFLLATDTADASFTAFSVSITDLMPGVEPDSVAIVLVSSVNGFCNTGVVSECLYLYVDDLALEKSTSTMDISNWFNQVQVYPNPASSDLNVLAPSGVSVQIHNVSGKLVKEVIQENTRHQLEVSHLSSGIYFISILQDGKVIDHRKLMKE